MAGVLKLKLFWIALSVVLDQNDGCFSDLTVIDKQYQENTTSAPYSTTVQSLYYNSWVLNASSHVPSGYNKW